MQRVFCCLSVERGVLRRQRTFSSNTAEPRRHLFFQAPAAFVTLTRALGRCGGTANLCDACSATCVAVRHAHVYSKVFSPRNTVCTRKKRKQYNYLTKSRMVEAPRKLTAQEQRVRDDKGMAQRNKYKQELLRNIEEKIRFFPPFVKKRVFFASTRHANRATLFRGHRCLGAVLGMRVTCHVLEQLKKAKERPFLVAKMKELGVEPPTEAEWQKFTDPETGDINIGILYSAHVELVLRSYSRAAAKGAKQLGSGQPVKTLREYTALHIPDPELVPSMESWAKTYPPLKDSDFNSRVRGNKIGIADFKAELYAMRHWARTHVMEKVASLSLEQQIALVTEAASKRDQILAELAERHLFATKIQCVLYELDEIKAIHGPPFLHFSRQLRQFVIEHKGAYYPSFQRGGVKYMELSKEEKKDLCPFGLSMEPTPISGQKLYIRFCSRDYGLPLNESARRYNHLSDLQRAALCFPFYAPIAPSRATVTAFKRFYREMCGHYGLVTATGPLVGNRIFEAAMRRRWRELTPAERAPYEESDRVAEVFPLVKPATKDASLGAVVAGTATSGVKTTAMAEYFTEDDHPRRSSNLDDLLASSHHLPKEGADDEDEEEEESSPGQSVAATKATKVSQTPAAEPRVKRSLRSSSHSVSNAVAVTPATTNATRSSAAASSSRRHVQNSQPSELYEGLRVIMM